MRWTKYFLLALITLSLTISESYGVNFKLTLLNSSAVAQTVNDREAEADRLLEQGIKQIENSQFQNALQSWENSLAIYQEIKNRPGIADSLGNLGVAYDILGDYRKAISYYEQSLAIKKKIGNRQRIVKSLNNLGVAYYNLGDYRKAIDYHQQSLAIKKKIGNREGIAKSLNNLGLAYDSLGDYREAINYHQQSLAILTDIGTRSDIAKSLNNLGIAYDSLGDYRKAIDYYQQSLVIKKKTGSRLSVAASMSSLGNAYISLGDYRKAIDYHQQDLAISKKIGNRKGVAESLGNLGNPYLYLGDYRKAIDYYQQSLAISNEIGTRQVIANAVTNLGNAYLFLRDYSKAIDYYQQSLAISKEIGNRGGIAASLGSLGLVYHKLGDYLKAIDYHQQSLEIKKKIGNRQGLSGSLANLGLVYNKLGDYHKAIDYYQQALVISKEIGYSQGVANSVGNLGLAYSNLGNYRKAIDYHQQSLKIKKATENPEGVGISLANLGLAYHKLGEYKNAKENLYQAIAIWEDIRKLLLDKDNWKVSIFEEQARTYLRLQQVLVAQKQPLQALEISERGRTRALVEILFRRINNKSSEELIPPTLNLAEIQQIAQQQNATLVEYSVTPDEIYIWVIPPQGKIQFRAVTFPKDTSLSELVKVSRESIGVRGRNSNNYSTKENNPIRLKQLHQLLIKPIESFLPKDEQQRVIFIPHQELFLVPFVALQDEENKYLIEKHTILTAPSIQALSLTQKNQLAAKPNTSIIPSSDSVLIVGNPTMPKEGIGKDLKPLEQLEGAEDEAKKIAQMLNAKAIIGSQATESTIVQKMASAKLIHLATHGLLDDINAIGSPGAIALTPDSKNDGFLTTGEIMERFGLSGKQKLQADLIVLSACDTGRGDIRGEGVIGLSRALMASGVPTLVVSLWKVPDDHTVKLMTEFYNNIYKRKFDKAKAMREAMLTMLNDDDGNPDPNAWAAFTVIGKAE